MVWGKKKQKKNTQKWQYINLIGLFPVVSMQQPLVKW